MKEKICLIWVIVVSVQLLLLINLPLTESYFISESEKTNSVSIENIDGNILDSMLKKSFNMLVSFFTIKQIGIVSASDLSINCCPLLKNGAICENVLSTDTGSCAVTSVPSSCDQVLDCKKGCCVDQTQGLCSPQSTKKKCETEGGLWKDEANCLVDKCQKGCCVLGNNAFFATEKRCDFLSLSYSTQKDFRDYQTELDCLALSATTTEGACVIQDKCIFTSERECLKSSGMFSGGYLCSHPSLESNCTRQNKTSCVEGKDEIYWFDSCGNKENIYSSDKNSSWNNGKVLSKAESCNPSVDNINSNSCGNCNFLLGSKCNKTTGNEKIQDGNFVCKSMKCIDEKGKTRNNGESWCSYDGLIGDGKDTVGSRHWKFSCVEGKVMSEPCADYRGQVCASSEIKENEKTFSVAACVINEAALCIGYNKDKATKEEQCKKNPHCVMKNIDVDKGFKFSMCAPAYPRGFEQQNRSEIADKTCSMANQKCTVIYVKDWKGSWNCEQNCDCETKKFAEQMNDLCVSLGDCGTYINYIGKGTDNTIVKNSPNVKWQDYVGCSKPVAGQKVNSKSLDEILTEFGGDSGGGVQKAMDMIGTVTGAAGGLLGAYGVLFGTSTIWYAGGEAAATLISPGLSGALPALGPGLTALGTVLIAAGIGYLVGGWIASYLGLTGLGATVMAIAGAVAGAGIGILLALGGSNFWNPVGWVLLAIGIILMVYTWLIGWGKTKEVTVSFKCMPWQAPTGGDDCAKCNENSLKPCSKYRCESLGQACGLLNEETENPICEAIEDDGTPPIITPGQIINGSVAFFDSTEKEVSVKMNDSSCIQEFYPAIFSLETDEYAQCKIDFNNTNTYEQMTDYPAEGNIFSKNHTLGILMPSLDALSVYEVTGDLKAKFGNMSLNVRCMDANGNTNIESYRVKFCIRSGPDLTPAWITASSPASGSFAKYNATQFPIKIFLNEPANCKWSKGGDANYGEMTNEMNCTTDLEKVDLYGWACETNLTGLTNNSNNFYIKCLDQPWLTGENASKRNTNTEGMLYVVKKAESNLKIDSITPNSVISYGFEPAPVDLKVKTSGGAEAGNAVCSFSFNDYSDVITFFNTFSNEHKQTFSTMMHGEYTMYVKCEDAAGNIAQNSTWFRLDIDATAPEITRAFESSGNLNIETNEDAICYYSFNNCYFDKTNTTKMSLALTKKHSVKWENRNYYIKCQDSWGNTNPGCARVIRPDELEVR